MQFIELAFLLPLALASPIGIGSITVSQSAYDLRTILIDVTSSFQKAIAFWMEAW